MMDEIDSEPSQLNVLVTYNLAVGNTIGMVFYVSNSFRVYNTQQ